MAIEFKRTKYKGGFPVFWRGNREALPGDFKLKGTYPEGTLLKEGTPIKLDFANMECKICKSALVVTGGTTSAPRVVKGSMFQVGDTVKIGESNSTIKSIDTTNADKIGESNSTIKSIDTTNADKTGESNSTIKSIDTTNADYDVLTFTAAVTGATQGATLLSDDDLPDAVIETTKEYTTKHGFPVVSAAYGARILKDVAYPVPEAWLEGYSLKNNHEIKYIRQ